MANSYQEMFRTLGEDISNAILGPEQARIKVMQLREDQALKKAKAQDYADKTAMEKQKAANLNTAADRMETMYGKTAGDLIRAGQPVSGVASLLALQRKSKEKGKEDDPTRYTKIFDLANKMTTQVQSILDQAQERVVKAKQSGDDAAFKQEMESYNTLYDALGTKLKNQVYSMDKDLRESYASNLAINAEKVLQKMSPAQVEMLNTTIPNVIKQKTGIPNDVLDDLEGTNNQMGLGIDLSGVPSSAEVNQYVTAGIMNKAFTQEQAKLIQNTRNPEDLVNLAKDTENPPEMRKLAVAIVKQRMAADQVDAKLSEKVSAMQDDELSQLGVDDNSPARIRRSVGKEIENRKVAKKSRSLVDRAKKGTLKRTEGL